MLPKSITKEFDELEQIVTQLHFNWQVYESLFLKNEDRIKLLNYTAPAFFIVVQIALIKDILISIIQLTDKHKTKSNKNLTLDALIELLSETDFLLKTTLNDLKSKLLDKTRAISIIRNKRLSHFDYKTFLDSGNIRKIIFNKESVIDSLALISQFMNEIRYFYIGQHIITLYSENISIGSVEHLIGWLKSGVKFEEAISTGKINDIHLYKDKFPKA
ncbi:MAG TPA: hypothetical protein DCE78_10460 [Bacteroidetes bacterium]|nr:hypothetical protein [Bacteroidota bacterium]